MRFHGWSWLVPGMLAAAGAGACDFDWDRYDPRQGAGGTAAGGGAVGGGGTSPGGGGTAAGGGGSGPGGSGGSEPCGTMGVFADDFDDGIVGPGWYVDSSGGATIAEVGGERVIVLPDLSASRSGFGSWYLADLRSARISIEVPTMVNTATDAAAFLNAVYDSENYAVLSQTAGTLHCAALVGNVWTELETVPYDPIAHRFWQFREAGGTLYWETSSDGVSFVERASASAALLFPVDALQVEFGASTSGTESAPGEAHFDNLNGGPPARAGWCAPNVLTDDFEDGARARAWWRSYEGGGCNHDESDGTLQLRLQGSGTYDCAYLSGSAFDLTGSAATVEAANIPTSLPNAYTFFRLQIDEQDAVEFVVNGDQLISRAEVGGNWQHSQSVSFDAVAHRYLRIREQGGTVYWETSPDGAAWTERNQTPAPIALTALTVALGAGNDGTGAVSYTAELDNYNLLP